MPRASRLLLYVSHRNETNIYSKGFLPRPIRLHQACTQRLWKKQYQYHKCDSASGATLHNHFSLSKIWNRVVIRESIDLFHVGSECRNFLHVIVANNIVVLLREPFSSREIFFVIHELSFHRCVYWNSNCGQPSAPKTKHCPHAESLEVAIVRFASKWNEHLFKWICSPSNPLTSSIHTTALKKPVSISEMRFRLGCNAS